MGDLKKAGEILETVVDDGNEELGRASLGLGLSGLAAGLNVSFSAVALGVVGALTGGVGLVAALLYPIGFLIVILGRSQLYTENTVTPVAVVLTDSSVLWNMRRRWVVIFVANVIGAILFAATVVYGEMLPPPRFAGPLRRGCREAGSRVLERDPQGRRRRLAGGAHGLAGGRLQEHHLPVGRHLRAGLPHPRRRLDPLHSRLQRRS